MSSGSFYINSEKEWRDAVQQAADVVLEEVEEKVKDQGEDYKDALDEALDSRAEAWTMYYADMRGILKWTDNIDAYFDQGFGDLTISDSQGALMGLTPIAYYAFRQDVIDHLDEDALSALEDYDEDDEDEEPQRTSVRRSMQRKKQPRKNPRDIRRMQSAAVLRRFLRGT